MAQPLGVVHVFVPSPAAVDRLPQQVAEGKLGVLPPPQIAEVLPDELAEAQTLVQFADENQAPSEVTRDPWKSIFREALKES